MRSVFLLLGIAFLLAVFWQAEICLIEHVELVRSQNIYRLRLVWNEL